MDKLKKLAERLGYVCDDVIADRCYIFDKDGQLQQFNPLTNNDQFVEVLEWLIQQAEIRCHHHGDKYYFDYFGVEFTEVERDFRQAVLNAALAIGDE